MEKGVNLQSWMSQLPENCQSVSINALALPGSHNSLTFDLDKNCHLSPDAPGAVQNLAKVFGPLAKSIVCSWSTNQSLSVTDQLNAGIRYFDIRVSSKPGTEQLFAVHGLYGPEINSCLDDFNKFLDSHPREIVLLDFNHFYGLDSLSHDRLIQSITDRFSSKMCPVMDTSSVTLKMMWETGLQLIVFYHNPTVSESCFQLWPSSSITAPWYNKTAVHELLVAIDKGLEDRAAYHSDVFHVTQGILTPDNGCIMANLAGSLKTCMCSKLAGPLVDWVRRQRAGRSGINVVTMDFVEMDNFVSVVVDLNFVNNS